MLAKLSLASGFGFVRDRSCPIIAGCQSAVYVDYLLCTTGGVLLLVLAAVLALTLTSGGEYESILIHSS